MGINGFSNINEDCNKNRKSQEIRNLKKKKHQAIKKDKKLRNLQ